MAAHVSEQIIAALVTVLDAGTSAGVFGSEVYPLTEAELPALLVDQGDEQIEVMDMSEDPDLMRLLEVKVIAKVLQNTGYRAAVNALRVEVEKLVAANRTLGGLCSLTPTGCTIELEGDGEQPIASATMLFEARYVTKQSAPDVSI